MSNSNDHGNERAQCGEGLAQRERDRVIAVIAVGPGETPPLVCLRARLPGVIESAAHMGEGPAADVWATWTEADGAVMALLELPRDPATAGLFVADCVRGAILVCWDTSELVARLERVHASPADLLRGAVARFELSTVALLVGATDADGAPTREALAARLGLEGEPSTPLDEALRTIRIVRHLIGGEAWLAQLAGLSSDERAILRTSARRLIAGRSSYGPWSLTDGTDLAEAGFEGVIDALHFAAAGLLRVQAAAAGTAVR